MAWVGRTGWRVEERPKKTDPAVDNPAVAVPKLKSKGNKRVEVGGGDKRLGRARIGEETVPVLHGHVERLDVGEFRGVKAGESEQKVGRARGRRTSAQPKGRTESKRVENRMVRRGPEVEAEARRRSHNRRNCR